MIKPSQIRKGALNGIRGSFALALFLAFLLVLSVFLEGLLAYFINSPIISLLSSVFIFSEITAYILFWYYQKVSINSFPPPNYFKMVLLSLSIYLKAVFYAFLFFLVPFSFLCISRFAKEKLLYFSSDIFIFCLDILVIMLLITGLIFYIFFMLRYFLSPFILYEEDIKIKDALKESVRIMKKEWAQAAGFLFSLSFYLLPSLLVVPAFYFMPKIIASVCLYARYLLEKSRMIES
jgi:hypothetical protein